MFIGILESGSEWGVIVRKELKSKYPEKFLNNSRLLNALCRPSVKFDICVVFKCASAKSGNID
jgi:hypothetical protein